MPRPKLYRANDSKRPASLSAPKELNPEPYRSDFRRDYARIIHSAAFRRLQGKAQLFPSHENDFFRNRLTHSLEVCQIAKSIAIRINSEHEYFKKNPIDLNLVELAALAHDLGHPPFGHNGEMALDEKMRDRGGFEGNAQTLRILARLEKKQTTDFPHKHSIPISVDKSNGRDLRLGLNLTYRALASILKYDNKIPNTQKGRKDNGTSQRVCKGYYDEEKEIVSNVKKHVAPNLDGQFKTIECSIMDVADDIAYSTYDIEDSFKAGFLSPIQMISMPDSFKKEIAESVENKIEDVFPNEEGSDFGIDDINDILGDLFQEILDPSPDVIKRLSDGVSGPEAAFLFSAPTMLQSQEIIQNGYLRTAFTSELVGRFIRDVDIVFDRNQPYLSCVRLKIETFKIVETLKRFSYVHLIESPRLKIAEHRGKEIVKLLFDTFLEKGDLLPEDWRFLYMSLDDNTWRTRLVCDYVAGMTDRYCVETYIRLTGHDPVTIFKPH